MGTVGSIAGALAGAGRGYEAAQGRNIPGPAQNGQQHGGLLMQYLNRRRTQQNAQQAAQLPNPESAAPKPSLPPGFDVPPADPSDGPPMAGPSLQPPPLNGQAPQPGRPPVGVPPNGFSEPMMGGANRFAQGQVVSKPTTAILGEDGPEAVIPLNGRPDAKLSTANLPQMQYRRGGC